MDKTTNRHVSRFEGAPSYISRYQELENEYKAVLVDKYLELKMIKHLRNDEIAEELNVPMSKIQQYKRDLGYKDTKKHQTFTPEKRMEMSMRLKIAHKYKKEMKEEMEKLDSLDNISAEQYRQLSSDIKEKYKTNIRGGNAANTTTSTSNDQTKKSRKQKNKESVYGGRETYQPPEENDKSIRDSFSKMNFVNSISDVKENPSSIIKRDQSPLQKFLEDRDKPIEEKYNIDQMMASTSRGIQNILQKDN